MSSTKVYGAVDSARGFSLDSMKDSIVSGFNSAWEGLKTRFTESLDIFFHTFEVARIEALQAQERQKRQNMGHREAYVTGYLINLKSKQAIPVYEGTTYLNVEPEKGIRLRHTPPGQFQTATQLRYLNGLVEIMQPDLTTERFATNDVLCLGTEKFAVKLFPKEHRAIHVLPYEESQS